MEVFAPTPGHKHGRVQEQDRDQGAAEVTEQRQLDVYPHQDRDRRPDHTERDRGVAEESALGVARARGHGGL